MCRGRGVTIPSPSSSPCSSVPQTDSSVRILRMLQRSKGLCCTDRRLLRRHKAAKRRRRRTEAAGGEAPPRPAAQSPQPSPAHRFISSIFSRFRFQWIGRPPCLVHSGGTSVLVQCNGEANPSSPAPLPPLSSRRAASGPATQIPPFHRLSLLPESSDSSAPRCHPSSLMRRWCVDHRRSSASPRLPFIFGCLAVAPPGCPAKAPVCLLRQTRAIHKIKMVCGRVGGDLVFHRYISVHPGLDEGPRDERHPSQSLPADRGGSCSAPSAGGWVRPSSAGSSSSRQGEGEGARGQGCLPRAATLRGTATVARVAQPASLLPLPPPLPHHRISSGWPPFFC